MVAARGNHLEKHKHEKTQRDVLDELIFLEFLDDWKGLENIVTKAQLVALLDTYCQSYRCTPHFENWWDILEDKDLGRSHIANRFKRMKILQGHGDSRDPYVWHMDVMRREIARQTKMRSEKGSNLTLSVPLAYAHAFKYDVFKWTQVAIHVLRTRPHWMTTNLIGQAKTFVPRNVDPKEYADTIIEEMKKDPRMVYSLDAKDRGIFCKTPAFHQSVTLTVEAAIPKFTKMALEALEKVGRFPITTIWQEARRRYGFPDLRYNTKRDMITPEEKEDQEYVDAVVDGMRKDPRLEYVGCPQMTQCFFCLPPPEGSSSHASIVPPTRRDGGLRVVPVAVPLGAEDAAVKMAKSALKYLASHPRFEVQKIRDKTQFCLPPDWTHESYVDYIVERLRSDDRLNFHGDHFVLATKLEVKLAAERLVDDAIQKLQHLPLVSRAYIVAEAARLQPDNMLSLDEYVAGVIAHMRKDKRLVYGADNLGRGNFGLAGSRHLDLRPFTNGDEDFVKPEPPKAEEPRQDVVPRMVALALRHLETYEVFSAALVADELLVGNTPRAYVECIVEAMKEDTRMKFVPSADGDQLAGAFELAQKRGKKRKQRCGDVEAKMRWTNPSPVHFPTGAPKIVDTPEVKAQARRMKLVTAGVDRGPDEPVKSEPPIAIPLMILRFY
ncbi:hypothetical protein ACHHYP_02311 [Achlya hypogyna]|uniref:Uncharacterized protein n=1 Tax=Achlya hypogyna TaxID=1202772 RepID=A0A1V9Z6Z8_ACHHY|nr:hypothetical protein ACHHYP_02311 [Achlya hypogyna]